ncbi:hypothetical protein [Janibacter sp. GS2]|uniref:hypothetical protein n=1 Tax=Janibacter sp. GS2 TaxID=3442646 RepID=UPI003EBAB0C3
MAPTTLRLGTTAPLLAAALVLAGCGGSGSTEAATSSSSAESTSSTSTPSSSSTRSSTSTLSRTHTTSTSSTSTSTTSSTTPSSTSASTSAPTTATTTTTSPPSTTATTAAAAVGPQRCTQVTTAIGDRATVEIISGDVDCTFAVDLLTRYYTNPPSPPQGSGGYVDIGEWNCNSSSSQAPGRASTCRTQAGGEIIAHAPTSAPTPTTSASAPAPATGSCAQIDQPTLDQMFPDGVQDEQKCANFIGGEAGH